MASRSLLLALLVLCIVFLTADAWSGNVCTRLKCGYRYRRVCRYRWWGRCCSWKTVKYAYYYVERFCCRGWRHNGNQVCNIRWCVSASGSHSLYTTSMCSSWETICSPNCQNGGRCVNPGVCDCPDTHTGLICNNAVCSYRSPCYPGTCTSGDSCTCSPGFVTTTPVNKQNYCLKIVDNDDVDLRFSEMQVRMSYWPTYANPPMELHWIMADSTNSTTMDVNWSNRRIFNRIETTCTSQYYPPALTSRPPYIEDSEFGIVDGIIEFWLMKKLSNGSIYTSLNRTFDCNEIVSSTSPETNVFNCSIQDPSFDRSVSHGDSFKVTFKTSGGGFRRVFDTDTRQTHITQPYLSVTRELSVQFRFDFLLPYHCSNNGSCSVEQMLEVPDITKTNPITIQWSNWTDADSGVYRYAWEVFLMTKTADGGLEIKPSLALSPLINKEVLAANYTPQTFTLPEPGMYSVILEVGDRANNTRFIRRLVLYDPDSTITTDPQHDLFVSSASAAAQYSYQNNLSRPINVTWDQYFRNAFQEDNFLLGAVRPYPPELRDDIENIQNYRKVIPYDKPVEDHEGERTVDAILNKRGIVDFYVQYARDHDGGLTQPQIPTGSWIPVYINTTYEVPVTPSEADTVTVWVKAKDIMDNELTKRTQVTFDSTPPRVQNLTFDMNVPIPGIDFSSRFVVTASDPESGIAYIDWVFTLVSNNTVIYRERMQGIQVPYGCDFTTCSCTTTRRCFPFKQNFGISNCHMMVEKENLDTEKVKVVAYVTNMAGLVTPVSMLKDDLTELNGTEAYYPPQNITIKSITQTSVTITWSFPPSCFARTALWVIVNGEKRAVHKDAQEFAVTGLEAGKAYTIYMVTDFVGNEQSNRQPFQFKTVDPDPFPVGAIVGIIIGFLILVLLVVLIVIFCLWKRGVIFQKEGTRVNRQLHRVSRALTTVRKTVYKGGGAFDNAAYKADPEQDDIYLYGAMTFSTTPTWHIEDNKVTLLDHVGEGRFATIYKAHWARNGKEETVAAKMLKQGFSDDDAMKMMAKINFMATQLEDHPNVIRFLGAVTDNAGWGPVMIMEYCECGQLDKWLVKSRKAMDAQVTTNLFQFALGIARGMEYLISKRVLHRRLAARNILLNFLLEPKVAGFGPTEREGTEEKTTRVPVKWAAPEVLQERKPTDKSDVWSYGVVLWEIFSMGETPYADIRSAEIGTRLKSGYRMSKPEFADDTMEELMQQCWQLKPSKRPTFTNIRTRLQKDVASANRQSTDFYYDTSQLRD